MSWVWRILPKKFRFQVSLLVVLMASLGIALFAWYMARQQGKLVTDTLEKTALVLSQNLAFDAANFLIKQDYASLEMVLKQYASLPDVTRVSISNEGKPLLTVTHEDNEIKTVYAAPAPTLEFLSQGQSQKIEYVSQEHELRIVQAVVAGPSRLGVVSLHYSLRSSLLVQEEVYKNTFSFGTLAVLLALLLLLIYLRKPIEAVQRASAFVAQLDLKQGQQLEPEYFAQEFETLSKSLNLVSQRLFEKEQDLQTSKLRLEAMLSHTVDGILNLDEELRISSANPAVERLFGYPARMLLGKSWTVLFPEAGIAWLDLEINKEYDKPIMAKHRAGFRFPVSFASSQIKVAGTRFYSLRIHDMTERYAYEKALREREAEARKLSLVASRTSNAVVLTDAEGRIEWVNAGFTRITEYALEEVKAKKPGDILQGPETCQETIKTISESLRQVKSARAELLNYSKSGRKYWVNLEIKPIFDEQGKLSNFMAIESDVTERRQAALELERALKAAEAANKAKSEFLSRMSHELRTPLNAILGFGQLLELEPLPESQRESVDHIVLAGHHLLELIDEILDISRIETGKMHLTQEPIALDLLLEEVMSLLKPMAQKKAVRFVVGSITGMTVTADAKRLKQVLLNLLNNAIKYNRQGGKVFIELTELEPSRLCLTIKDTGMGISEANLSRLFTPFDRLGADVLGIEGTGIGLVLSKSLIEAMDGHLKVESREGLGSCFSLELPGYKELRSASSRAEVVKSQPGQTGYGSYDLLYIEDNRSNIALLEAIVAMRPELSLRVALNAREGRAQLAQKAPDLLLLDLHLPDEDGQRILEDLRRARVDFPVLIVSADVTPARLLELETLGMDGFISKPIQVKELLSRIDHLVASPRLELKVG